MKQCRKCEIYKEYSAFNKKKEHRDGLHSYCKKCRSTLANRYRKNHPQQHRDNNKKYYLNNIEKCRSARRRNYIENADRYREIARMNRKNNIDRYKGYWRAREKRVLCQTPAWAKTGKIMKQIANIYSNRPSGYHVDHIVPIKGKNVSGLHIPWNLQYLPEHENLSKSNRFDII